MRPNARPSRSIELLRRRQSGVRYATSPVKDFSYVGNDAADRSFYADLGGAADLIINCRRETAGAVTVYSAAMGWDKRVTLQDNTSTEATDSPAAVSVNNGVFYVSDRGTANASPNNNTDDYTLLALRKLANFLDVVKYTGTGSATTIAHSLGRAPGWIIVRRLDVADNPVLYYGTTNKYIPVDSGAAEVTDTTVWNDTAPTTSVFSVGTSAKTNANGGTYVAIVFAADYNSSDAKIKSGTYTGNGNATGPSVTGIFRPRLLFIRGTTGTSRNMHLWAGIDNSDDRTTSPQSWSNAVEIAGPAAGFNSHAIDILSDGFQIKNTAGVCNANTVVYQYLAIG